MSNDVQQGHDSEYRQTERSNVFKTILASRVFIIVTVSTALAYFAFTKYLDFVTATAVMATGSYFVLFYLLVGVSSVLMGLTAYSLQSKLSAGRMAGSNAASGSSSAGTSLFGAVVSCSCHTSLLLPLLTSLGLSAFAGVGIIASLVVYQLWILGAFVVVDLYLVYRTLSGVQARARVDYRVSL